MAKQTTIRFTLPYTTTFEKEKADCCAMRIEAYGVKVRKYQKRSDTIVIEFDCSIETKKFLFGACKILQGVL